MTVGAIVSIIVIVAIMVKIYHDERKPYPKGSLPDRMLNDPPHASPAAPKSEWEKKPPMRTL